MLLLQAKTYHRWIMMAALVLCVSVAAQAQDENFGDSAQDANGEYKVPHDTLRTLGRGFTNLFFGVFELPKNIVEINTKHGGFAAITWGTLLGFQRWGQREVQGIHEIGNCRHPEKIVILQEFPYDHSYDDRWRVRHMEESY